MATPSIDAAVLQRTRDTLGKVIKKPPLTDKLLSKPPFRYLHDIIVEVVKSTGFFEGLYTPKELDSQNVQEKDDKVAFLQKAIDTLSFVTEEVLKVKPSKIVSGQEPERTNEFLQRMAISILKQCDSKEAVEKVLQGEKPSEALGKDKKRRTEKPAKDDKPERTDVKSDKAEKSDKVDVKPDHPEGPDASQKSVKPDKADKPERPDKSEKVDRPHHKSDKTDKAERTERPHKTDKTDKPDKSDKGDKSDRTEKRDRTDKGDRADRTDKGDRADRTDKGDRADRTDKGDRADRTDKGDRADRTDKQKSKPDKPDKKKNESSKSEKSSKSDKPDKSDKPVKPDKSVKSDKTDKPDKPDKTERLDKAEVSEKKEKVTNGTTQPSDGPDLLNGPDLLPNGPEANMTNNKENGEVNTHTNGGSKDTLSEDPKTSRKDLSGGARTRPKDLGNKDVSSPGAQRKHKNGLQASSDKQITDPTPERPKHQPSRRRTQAPGSHDNHEGEGSGHTGEGSETALDRPPSARGFRRPSMEEDSLHPSSTTQLPEHTSSSSTLPPQPRDPPSDVTQPPRPSSPPPQPVAPPTGIVLPSARPPSARPAPPKIVRRTSNEEPADARIPSGTAAPPPPSVILDKHQDDDNDDDIEYVMKEPLPPAPPTQSDLALNTSIMKAEGALTQAIVATKERLEGDQSKATPSSHVGAISEAQRKKEREMVMKEVEKLQSSIQTLCKSANPLGRIMDYVQEDTDSMQKELEMWRAENTRHSEAMKKEEGITHQELAPLRTELERLEARISEQIEIISATKANILRNDDKIHKMLNSIAFLST